MTTSPRVRQALTVLDQVLDAPQGRRSTLLAEVCGDDSALRHQVESLLAFEEQAEGFLETPVVPGSAVVTASPEPLAIGDRLGPYEICEELGEGGMGAVFGAVRAEDYEQRVAIKRIHTGILGRETSVRFHRERQILARLEHPRIARLLDGGTEEGQPYLVMERIEGSPIDRFCREQELGVGERLELFLEVCSAVAFAHRNLVIHRDLKPGNILVTDEGEPKLLDFGIAKLVDDGSGGESEALLTRTASAGPMTLRYASPEQVRGEPIATASDQYSLGVVLYELLTGELPCQLQSCTPAHLPYYICEREPERPSSVVGGRRTAPPVPTDLQGTTASGERVGSGQAESRTAVPAGGFGSASSGSAAGGDSGPVLAALDPRQLRQRRRQLVGDVDAIVLRCLRKRPEERYESVDALAADIRRHLDGLPVAARRGTWLYLTGRWARRHRRWLAVAAAVLVALVAFLVRERDRLEREQLRSQRLEEVLEELILTADPDTGNLTADKLLDRAENQIGTLEDEPRLRGELLDSLGWLHHKLGQPERARRLATESLEAWRELSPGDNHDLALRINNVGALLLDQGDHLGAETLMREALAMRQRMGEGETEAAATYLSNLAAVLLYRGAWEESEAFYQQSLDLRRGLFGDGHPKVASSLRSLGAFHRARGDLDRAEPLLRQALAIRRQVYGDGHTAVASVLDLLARVQLARGELHEGEALLQRALAIRRQKLGHDHPNVAWSELALGGLLLREGDLAAARPLIVPAVGVLTTGTPPVHPRHAEAVSLLGWLLVLEGREREARPCLEAGYETLRRVRSEDAADTREARRRLSLLEGSEPITAPRPGSASAGVRR